MAWIKDRNIENQNLKIRRKALWILHTKNYGLGLYQKALLFQNKTHNV